MDRSERPPARTGDAKHDAHRPASAPQGPALAGSGSPGPPDESPTPSGRPTGAPHRPRASYGPVIATYAVVVATAAALVRSRARPLPRPSGGELILIGLAVFRLSRLVTKDKVLQPLREPFVESEGPGTDAEVNSQPVGT